jgi:hypothetical protein
VSRRKLARIETNPYTAELLGRGVEFVTETNETFNSVLDASVIHTSNVGVMLMDEIAHVNERVDGRREEIEKLEKEQLGFQEWTLKTEDEQEQQGMAIDRLKVRNVGSGVINSSNPTFLLGRDDHVEGLDPGSSFADRKVGGRQGNGYG